jgi:Glycosyl hydrolase family 65, N-terminal domain
MIKGCNGTEVMQLNEDTVWYGGPQSRVKPDTLRNLPKIRVLVAEGGHIEADKLIKADRLLLPVGISPLATNCAINRLPHRYLAI